MSIELINVGDDVRPSRPYDFYIDLRSPLGNPYTLNEEDLDEENKYQFYFEKKIINKDYGFLMYLKRIITSYIDFGIVRLLCGCDKDFCHGRFIKEWIEKVINKEIVCNFY